MGMFDSFYFAEGILPGNMEGPEREFQSKTLECELNEYRVARDGSVTLNNGDEIAEPIYVTAWVYSYSDHTPSRFQHYKVVVGNNRLIRAALLEQTGYHGEDE